ncbi:MAG: InlB B-repeat-containing protein, partial [Butyrivibrio sp.]|nr:InlB B-repeat-containing protein [Butyrivibrio sp.]
GSTPDHPFYKDAPVPTEIPEGCRFTGWYEDQALTKPITNEEIREYVTTDDVTFYAGYEEVCTITYKFANDDKKGFIFVDDNRNDPESDDYVIKAAKGKPLGDAFPIVKYENPSDRLNTEQDYVFDGFYLSSDANPGSKIDLDSYIITGDTVLYAGFTSEMFTITFKDHDEILRKICIPKGGSYRYYDREKDAETVYGCPELLNKRYDYDTRPATRPTGLWTTNADGSGEIWSLNEDLHFYIDESGKKVTLGDNGFVPRSDMTFYAQYTETIKLSLDTDDYINKSASIKNRVLWFDEYNFDKEKTEHFAYVGKGTLYGYLGISDHRSKFKYDINNDKKFYRLGFKDKDCNEVYDISDAITKDNTVIYSKKSLLKAKVELCSGEGYFNEKTEMGSYIRYRTHELPDDYNESYGIIFDEPLINDKTRAFLGFYYPLTSDPESPDMNRPYQYMMYKEGKCTLVFPESVLKAAYNNLWLVAAYGTSVNVTLDAGEGAYFERENESSQNANDKYIREKTRIQKVAAGKNMVLSSHLSEIRNSSGRRFLGWYYRDDEDNEQKLVTSETGGAEYFRAYEDITIYAKWSGEPGDEQLPDISSLSIYGPINALKIGEKYETGIIVESSGTYDLKNVKWIVSDCTYDDSNNIKRQPVIVENNGNIIARAAGTAKIYAELDGVISNTITVTVSNEIIPAGVLFDPDITDYNLEIGDSVRVDLTFNPTWLDEAIAVTSTIPEVAEVRFLGNCLYIDAKKAGATIINLKSDIIDVSIGVSVSRPAEKVKAPISDPEVLDGETLTVDAGTVLRLYSETLGARIYYTTDGSEPDEASAEFVGTLNLDASKFTGPEESLTIKAKAYKGTDYAPSDTVTFTYKLSSDWGDITDDLKASVFENKISNVPTDLWYVIDGNRVDEKLTDYKVTYTGSKITFDDKILVYHGKRRLWQNRDYTLKYSNNINAAANDAVNKKNKSVAPSLTIKGKGSYAKTRVFAFEILKADIDDSVISSERVMSLSKAAKLGSVKPVITYNGKKLVAGSDYVLKFYKGDAVSEDKLIADPAKYVPSKDTEYTEGVYTIAIEDAPDSADGKKGINFKAHDDNKPKADTIKVLTFDPKDKKIVQASKLKAAMIGSNKAVKLAYFDEATESSEMSYYYDSDGKVDLEKVFDNGEGKKP